MIRLPLRPAAIAAAALAVALAGCVSVLPKTEPAQLYSFVKTEPPLAETASAPAGEEVGLLLGGLSFPRAASGDGILTRTGAEAAYIAGARWVGPASILFREATDNVFDRGGAMRLISRGEIGRASGVVRLDVRDFEARYGPDGGPPVAVVSLEARLTGVDGAFVGVRRFEASTPASDNRIGPIVEALTASTDKVLSDTAAWVQTEAAALPASEIRAPGRTGTGLRATPSGQPR